MSLKDLVAFIDSKPASERCADVAVHLARRHHAHLAGVHVMSLSEVPAYMRNARYVRIHRIIEEAAKQRAESAERMFKRVLERTGVAAEGRLSRVNWIHEGLVHARYADIAIVSQIDPEDHLIVPALHPEEVMLSAGRPVLVVPYAGTFATVGERVLVAWNGGREAARAVNDALPLLATAQSVTVLSVNPKTGKGHHGDIPGADIGVHLARHGAKVTVETCHASDLDVADVLLNRAADLGADLLVTGGYGRSRMRELVLGGVTGDLLRRMTVPVLMSH